MKFTIETEQEVDGRWIAEMPEISGVLQYGNTREEAIAQAEALALRVMAERIEHGGFLTARTRSAGRRSGGRRDRESRSHLR